MDEHIVSAGLFQYRKAPTGFNCTNYHFFNPEFINDSSLFILLPGIIQPEMFKASGA
jgi:hypothetical protein